MDGDRVPTPPGFWSRRPLLIIILLLVALLLFFSHAGRKDVHTGDEARTMLIARDMLRAGDWFVPRIQQGRVILTKPPFLFWAIALLSTTALQALQKCLFPHFPRTFHISLD